MTGHFTVNSACDAKQASSSDFADTCGHLLAIKLPAGDYVINNWNVNSGGPGNFPAKWEPMKFTIAAEKATYIGDIHMTLVVADKPVVGPLAYAGWPKVKDQHERDVPLLLQRYPQLRQDDIAIAVLTFPPPGDICALGNGLVGPDVHCGN